MYINNVLLHFNNSYIGGLNMITLFLCKKIFFVRIIDVSLGTIRTIMTVKNKRFIAAFIGFFEVLIWFLIVRKALDKNDSQILIALFFL